MKAVARKQRARRGFTLVEILLVVVIIAMLAGIVGTYTMGQLESAKVDTTTNQIDNFEKSLDTYRLKCDRYPTTDQGLKALVEKPTEDPVPKKWVQQMKEIPLDQWGADYHYAYPGDFNGKEKPDIWSSGPDGEDGTEDDIVNWTVETEESESSGTRE